MINIQNKLTGEFRLLVKRADGTEEDTGWFSNLILDQGLDRLGNSSSGAIMQFAQVGSGTIAPAVTQTSLQTYVAGGQSVPAAQASSTANEGAPLYRTTLTYTFAFLQGAVVGNITEVGTGWAASGAALFSRALILDNLGNPTSITLVPIDQLTVFYRLRFNPILTDTTGSILLGVTNYNYTMRVSNVGSFANIQFLLNSSNNFSVAQTVNIFPYPAGSLLGPVTGVPTGTVGTAGTAVTAAYSPGTYYRDSTFTLSITQGNVAGGIQALRFVWPQSYSVMNFQLRFDTPIPKTNTNVLTLTLRFSWGRL